MSNLPAAVPKQHVTRNAEVCGGKPCIAGTRIRVWDIAVRVQAGESPDEVLIHFPRLTLADVHAALAYYYDNREAIENQAREDNRYVEQLREATGPGPLQEKVHDFGPNPMNPPEP